MAPARYQLPFLFLPLTSVADLKVEHFPLQTLSIFKPKFSIEGSVTGRGSIEANDDNIQSFFESCIGAGQRAPLRKKTAVAHQRFPPSPYRSWDAPTPYQSARLRRSVPRLFCFTALNLHGLSASYGNQSPRSIPCRTHCRRKIQDIFDFINIGTHHITGLLSCRLLLSQTYANPSLQGKIELQKGTYENYYTGTVLKQIEAEAEAFKDEIHLLSMTAQDEEKGELKAEGKLDLKPKANYPYMISSELDNLHLLRFDTIDCYLTGPLYITGTSLSALAEGNLTVSYATIRIPDQLPYDPPPTSHYLHQSPFPSRYNYRFFSLHFPFSTSTSSSLQIRMSMSKEKGFHLSGKALSASPEPTPQSQPMAPFLF